MHQSENKQLQFVFSSLQIAINCADLGAFGINAAAASGMAASVETATPTQSSGAIAEPFDMFQVADTYRGRGIPARSLAVYGQNGEELNIIPRKNRSHQITNFSFVADNLQVLAGHSLENPALAHRKESFALEGTVKERTKSTSRLHVSLSMLFRKIFRTREQDSKGIPKVRHMLMLIN